LTGAGKTYTMLGTDDEPGIMARGLNDLFVEMERTRDEMKYKVSMSYLEVHIQYFLIFKKKIKF
jgi:kinesin family protein 18/19